mmetsp:Transcript_84759/g.133891  ORF Transcript_84759/g.133891 Transcript_84759/m.133891 type:complete len:191 (-) Transcript_84759:250-822(-)
MLLKELMLEDAGSVSRGLCFKALAPAPLREPAPPFKGSSAHTAVVCSASSGPSSQTGWPSRRRPRARREPESEPETEESDPEDSDVSHVLKRLRLTEDYDCPVIVEPETGEEEFSPSPSDDMAVDEDSLARKADPCLHIRAFGGKPLPSRQDQAAWRAELQRRAAEEIQRYRQQLSSMEARPRILRCPAF